MRKNLQLKIQLNTGTLPENDALHLIMFDEKKFPTGLDH